MFCEPGLVLGGTEGVGSCFHVLRARVSFFMFCAPGVVFDGTVGVRSHFHVLRARTRFLLYRGRRVQFSCFALPDSFSTVLSVSGPFFQFALPD
jgi:hypothetical protein